MVANMAIPVKQPQLSPSTKGAADHHQYACLFKADTSCKADTGSGRAGMIPSPEESSNSWEARAFAEDASSLAAGIWPPRAYPCSFCRREFRSAQALGGHMNVHRRDRARLRQASPPPPPFRVPLNTPTQATSLIQVQQYTSPNLNPSPHTNLYPNESILKLNSLPSTGLTISSKSPIAASSSLAAKYPSDIAASFPLRLHILASEAASTLMFPQAEPSDLLSLWPASPIDSPNGPRSNHGASKGSTNDISSPSSSSVISCVTPSTGAILCRRAGDIIQPEDESPKKRSNITKNCGFQPYQIIKLSNSFHGGSPAHQITQINVEESVHIEPKREVRGEVDLELRLGHRPP
eukprot:c1416_g1_i1 orf=155-1204(-)